MARVPPYAANYIPALRERFESAGEALTFLRGQGLGVRRQNFLWEWGADIHERSVQQLHYTATLGELPTRRAVTTRRAPRARGFMYQIEHLVADPDTGDLFFTPGGWKGSNLVPYGQALAEAEQNYLRSQSLDPRCPQGELLGSVVSAVREYLPELEPDEVELIE